MNFPKQHVYLLDPFIEEQHLVSYDEEQPL